MGGANHHLVTEKTKWDVLIGVIFLRIFPHLFCKNTIKSVELDHIWSYRFNDGFAYLLYENKQENYLIWFTYQEFELWVISVLVSSPFILWVFSWFQEIYFQEFKSNILLWSIRFRLSLGLYLVILFNLFNFVVIGFVTGWSNVEFVRFFYWPIRCSKQVPM